MASVPKELPYYFHELKTDVPKAKRLLSSRNSYGFQQLVSSWLPNKLVWGMVEAGTKSNDLETREPARYLASGLASLIQLVHQHENTFVGPRENSAKNTGALRNGNGASAAKQKHAERSRAAIRNIEALIEYKNRLKYPMLPPWSINDVPAVAWLELVQEDAATMIRLGQNKAAVRFINEHRGMAVAIVTGLDEELTGKNIMRYFNPKIQFPLSVKTSTEYQQAYKYVGLLTGLAILFVRRGQAKGSLDDMLLALQFQSWANQYQPNPERTKLISQEAWKAIPDLNYSGSLGTRPQLLLSLMKQKMKLT